MGDGEVAEVYQARATENASVHDEQVTDLDEPENDEQAIERAQKATNVEEKGNVEKEESVVGMVRETEMESLGVGMVGSDQRSTVDVEVTEIEGGSVVGGSVVGTSVEEIRIVEGEMVEVQLHV